MCAQRAEEAGRMTHSGVVLPLMPQEVVSLLGIQGVAKQTPHVASRHEDKLLLSLASLWLGEEPVAVTLADIPRPRFEMTPVVLGRSTRSGT